MTATVEMPASEHDRKMSELARLRYANEDQAEKLAALRAALQLALKYLEHPDVRAIPFALHVDAAAERARAALAATGAK